MSIPTITNPGVAPLRSMPAPEFDNAAEAFFPALPDMANDMTAAIDWMNTTFTATDQARQQAESAQTAAGQAASDASGSAAAAAGSAQASGDSANTAATRRDEAQFWAEQAADTVGLPALAGNGGNVLTVDDDEAGFAWQAPTVAVTASLSSSAETAATYDWEVSASGTSRHSGGSIVQFQVRWWDGVLQDFTATAGAATLTRTVDEPEGATVSARVWAIDDLGNRSRPADISAAVVGNRPPEGPISISAPTQVSKNEVFQVSFSGASDPDGDPVTYAVTNVGAFTFDKTSGIAAGEIVEVTAPDVANDTEVTFDVVAEDDKGAQSATYSATVSVLAAQVIGVEMTATGGPGGTWGHIDEAGNAIATPSTSWFNGHPVWGGMQDVMVDGQYLVEVPKFYWKRGTSSAGNPAWWVSDQPLAGFAVHPAFVLDGVEVDAFQYGKYQASEAGGKLQSLPGVLPKVSTSLTDFLALAVARNVGGVEGFRVHHYDMWLAIQWLYLVEMATMDSQTATGEGRVNQSSAANVDAADVAQATYRGIVGLWGNVYQWMDGVRTLSSVIERRTYNGGWVSTGEAVPNGGSNQYPITFRATGDESWVADTYSTSNDNTATLPDYRRWRDAGEYYPFVGGYWSFGAFAGLWYVDCYYSASYSVSYLGARLARVV